MTASPRGAGQRGGKVRSARLTDLAAVGELSRLSHLQDDGRSDGRVRSLGLPVSSGQISVFSLFRLPLGAFQPHDQLYVYEERGRLAGLARVERETPRDEWTIVELDAVDNGEAGDIRFRLIQHLLRDGSRRGAVRFHVACADASGNVELFMQAGFARYGEERILYRSPDKPLPGLPPTDEAAAAGIRSAVPLDALPLDRLYRAATPTPVSRLEAYRLHDWERQGSHWRIPRSALTPILRFADIEGHLQYVGPAQDPHVLAFVQVGVAKEDQPHYIRVICRPEHDPSALIRYGMGIIGERTGARRGDRIQRFGRPERGIVSAVRTYESPLDSRLEEQGFEAVATVSLLMKETQVRVAEPALVPATSR
jgi:hypothetical protein